MKTAVTMLTVVGVSAGTNRVSALTNPTEARVPEAVWRRMGELERRQDISDTKDAFRAKAAEELKKEMDGLSHELLELIKAKR